MFFKGSKHRYRKPTRIAAGEWSMLPEDAISAPRLKLKTVAESAALERESIKDRLMTRRDELLEQKKEVEDELAITELEISASEAAEKVVGQFSMTEDELIEGLEVDDNE